MFLLIGFCILMLNINVKVVKLVIVFFENYMYNKLELVDNMANIKPVLGL